MPERPSQFENYILDAFWARHYLERSSKWGELLLDLTDDSPFFHINPVSFSIAWADVYSRADEDDREWMQKEVLAPLAGWAELTNRNLVTSPDLVLSAKNGRVLLGPNAPNSLSEIAFLIHEYPDVAKLGIAEQAELMWVLATYRYVSAEDDPTYLLVENVQPYLEVIDDLAYHAFSS